MKCHHREWMLLYEETNLTGDATGKGWIGRLQSSQEAVGQDDSGLAAVSFSRPEQRAHGRARMKSRKLSISADQRAYLLSTEEGLRNAAERHWTQRAQDHGEPAGGAAEEGATAKGMSQHRRASEAA